MPAIALNSRIFGSTDKLIQYARENGYAAIDYSFPYGLRSFSELPEQRANVEKIRGSDIETRFHAPLRVAEIASADKRKAADSLKLLKHCLDVCADFDGKTMTIHIGMNIESDDELDFDTAVAGLSELGAHGNRCGAVVCLENLTKGLTNHPESLLELVEKSGVSATFDLGHANASPRVLDGQITSLEFLETVAPHVMNAHVYEIEKISERSGMPYHVAPKDLNGIGPLLSKLLETDCDFWLVELANQKEAERVRRLLQSFLQPPA